jgi:hypothetical protein
MRSFRHRNSHDGTEVALANFALTFAKALLVFCVVMFMLINPQNGSDGSKPKAEYLISVEWTSPLVRYDVDTWTRLPNGDVVMFMNKEASIVFLERDDLGNDCKSTTNNGAPINICEEITVIRGVLPGEYQVSLHLFSVDSEAKPRACIPIQINVKIEKLNPTTTIVWRKMVILDRVRQELPIVRFAMSGDGKITDFYDGSELPSIINKAQAP